ncbi:PAS domain-containing sensor histidine kinase [Acinetobacter stercoris]|uniref:histidine kinase n=1 Tax=Acinetobacter stercoris TaxID=2126983 RepID=A0A2U3MZV3_9GAMM|nr:PAS domain S-box protein [Acinetobacter stercoris]SPL70903.1 Sensor protein FixL [Acinetobacter stercoris]
MTSLNYYQTIFDKAGDAIFVHDIGSVQFMDVNEAAVVLTGYSKSELTHMNVEKISAFHQGFDLHHALKKVQQVAASTDEAITFEWLIESKDKQQIPVEVCLKTVEIEQQPKLLALVRNISEIKKYQYALQSKDQYFKILLENSADGIAILDPQGKLLYASASLQRILGYRDRFVLNKNVLSVIHPNDRTAIRQTLFKHPTQIYDGVLHYRILHHNGEWHHHEASFKNLLNHPNIQGILINYRDITERIQAEQIARTREKQLGHMSRCKTMGELATALAHELNQPLAALNNYVGGSIIRIQNGLANTPETIAALNSALDQTQRVNRIIHSMRSFLRKGEANFQHHSLNSLIQDLHPLIRLKAEQGDCKVHYELNVHPLYIQADETLFSQVIINLVFNAVDALQKNPVSQRDVYIRTWQYNQYARIAIADNGPGLQGQNPEQLFESFYSSKSDSMGIGLTLSRSIIESHQGYLWVCEGDTGAIFNISLAAKERAKCM